MRCRTRRSVDGAISRRGGRIGGWKVGRVADEYVERFGAQRLVGPIFSDMIVETSGGEPVMPVLDGFAAVEAELIVRVRGDAPEISSIDDARDAVDAVRFGIEIASSPFVGINDHGPAVTASDFGNNHGLVLGPIITDWQTRDLSNVPVMLAIDARTVGSGCAADMLDGPFGAVVFLVQALARRGIALASGSWISTGAITGVHRATAGQHITASFGDHETVAVRLTAAPVID